ncbi:MAG: isoleucine--tRNA ligase, partial [Chitinivibrionales bacterium]|nr:isoleucine--tRNA ligase [Chitinivibrionales bacterium]
RSIVLRYTGQWENIVQKMGRWVDFERQYRTMDPQYMESIWWVFRQVWEKKLIYEGYRVQPYCPRCATPLSNFEVNEGYQDIQGPSITVTFPLADDPSTKILVWTTTPWTLPSNVALATGPDIRYVKVRDGDSTYILAKDRLPAYSRDDGGYEVIGEVSGRELSGLRYLPAFDFFADKSDAFFQVTTAGFVSTEDGTGIVHIAPSFGEDDFQVGAQLNLPIVCPVDDEGRFTDEVPPWKGRLVFDADSDIIRSLKGSGRLVHRSTIRHRYPFCYRCDTALIYKAITTWFMKIEPLKENMLAGNQAVHWVPEHLKNGRFGKGVESAPDWNISRNRYWGTPIPLWRCSCGHTVCIGSIEELHRLAGGGDVEKGRRRHEETIARLKEMLATETGTRLKAQNMDCSWAARLSRADIPQNDIHTHVVDMLKLRCPSCNKEDMVRTPEVLDCWFESGSMPYAQGHYPFENKDNFNRLFPADFIAEGLDQTRGWFYTLTVLASALFKKPAFKNVVVNGIILSEEGKKLSKRLKNYAPPSEVLDTLGADALRLFLINSPAVKAEDLRFSEKGIVEMSRSVLLPFWNAYSFFVTYANVDGWKPGGAGKPSSDNELDRWIVSLLNHVVASVNVEMEQYNLYRVVPNLVDFIDNLTNWYIRRSRRRFWKSENDTDKNDAYETLYYVLVEFSRVMAPFLPFLTEAIYLNLVAGRISGSPRSVHLTSYPNKNEALIDPDLEKKMHVVRQAVIMGRVLRSRFTIKNRQPLRKMTVIVKDDGTRELLKDMADLIKEELNVKAVEFDKNEDRVVTLSAKPNFRKLGRVFGPKMKEAAEIIEKFTPEQVHELTEGATIDVLGTAVRIDDIEIRRTKHEGIEVETQNEITVALDTEITPGLAEEGTAREFVNRVQNLRKKKDLDVTDRIIVTIACDPALKSAVTTHKDYVCNETLATRLQWEDSVTEKSAGEKTEINGMQAILNISLAK